MLLCLVCLMCKFRDSLLKGWRGSGKISLKNYDLLINNSTLRILHLVNYQ